MERPVLRGYEEYADLPDDGRIRVCSLGEIMAEKLWGSRLSGQMVDLPEFGGVYRTVRRAFRQAGVTGK